VGARPRRGPRGLGARNLRRPGSRPAAGFSEINVDIGEIEAWLRTARRGERIEYMRGYLPRMRHERIIARNSNQSVSIDIADACNAAQEAWQHYEAGEVLLTQTRYADFDYGYIMIRR
jgi:hypothetical protein